MALLALLMSLTQGVLTALRLRKMTFGRVSDLGQFIRESEPEPDVRKSKGSMFSQAMKKWVQGNTDEAQEELAWKIAKM
ncbi:A-kinase anchoring protein 10, partial [Homo sapiens]